jgi:hypothetical protein
MKQAERTPGPWTIEGPDQFGDYNIHHPADRLAIGAIVSNMRPAEEVAANARFIVEAVNAYTSTDALRSALHVAEQNFEAIRKVLVNNLVEPERSAFWLAVRARDAARTALAGVTDPQTDIAKR